MTHHRTPDSKKPTRSSRPRRGGLAPLVLSLAMTAVSATPAAAGEALTLRVNDLQGVADEVVAVVARTYASRPVGQGQICFRAQASGPQLPFAGFEGGFVFSEEGDAQAITEFSTAADGQLLLIEFSSPSATINSTDGPLLVLYFRLAAGLGAGQTFDVEIDPGDTFLFDDLGDPITIEPRTGELRVLAQGAPWELEIEDGAVAPGEEALIGVATSGLFAVGSGQIGLRYDAAIFPGLPQVTMDPRHGSAQFTVDATEPGLLVVGFTSPDGSLNEVPGELVRVALPTAADAPVGFFAPIEVDDELTVFADPQGAEVPLVLAGALIEIVPVATTAIFVDGFESGDLDAWDE